MAHAYFIIGETEEGIARALSHIEKEYALEVVGNPDVMVLRHGLLSVDDARRLRAFAELAPSKGDQKVLVISANRLFHEAQNALLKLFEEPPAGTVLMLVLPAEGVLLPTLRSRLQPLAVSESQSLSAEAQEFLSAKSTEREKMLEKIVNRSKSDKDEEKQAARMQAVRLVEGLTSLAHEKWEEETQPAKREALRAFLADTDTFLPILHERSAPLKLIFEHILLTSPL